MGAAQLSWAEELDLLTRFHPGNAAFSELGMMVEVGRDDCQADRKEEGNEVGGEEDYKSAHNTNKQTNMKNIGRGRKLSHYQKDDDCFIAQQIEKTLGSGHRAESIFNSSQTSTKTEKSLEKMSTPQKKSSSCSSPIQKNAAVSVTGTTVIRAKLSKKKNSTGSGSDVVASIMKEFKALGIGRGRGKSSSTDALLPVGAEALKMTKNGEMKQSKHLQEAKNDNNNNKNYFPAFDYDGYNKIVKASHWWAGNTTSGVEGKQSTQEVLKKKEENGVVVERNELAKWTPVDDSV